MKRLGSYGRLPWSMPVSQICGSSGISGEGRTRQKEGPAIAKVGGHRDTRRAPSEWPRNPRNPRTPTQPAKLFPLHPPTFSGEGGEHHFRGGAAGVRVFRGFRGSSGVGWKDLESSDQSLAPKFSEEPNMFTGAISIQDAGPNARLVVLAKDRDRANFETSMGARVGSRP